MIDQSSRNSGQLHLVLDNVVIVDIKGIQILLLQSQSCDLMLLSVGQPEYFHL